MEKWGIFVDFFLITGMSLLGILGFFLYKTKTGFSKRILLVFLASSFLFLLYYYAFLHKIRILGTVAFLFGNGVGYLLGPCLIFYLKALVFKKEKLYTGFLINLIPFFLVWIFISIPVALNISWGYFPSWSGYYADYADIFNLMENAFFLVYCLLSFRLTSRIMNTSKNFYSSISAISLQWFKYLVIGFILIILLDSILSIYELNHEITQWNVGTIIAFVYVILFAFLGYRGTFQDNIFLPQIGNRNHSLKNEVHAMKMDAENKKQINHLHNLDDTQIQELKDKLTRVLKVKKPYLNENLSLTELADEVGITNKQLSELLNQHLKINFYNLINEYRIEEFKNKLTNLESDKFTLLGIAYDCGFRSKASFNRVFKQKMGMTPSKYRKRIAMKSKVPVEQT